MILLLISVLSMKNWSSQVILKICCGIANDNKSAHELPAVVYSRAKLEVLETAPVLGKCDLSLKTTFGLY